MIPSMSKPISGRNMIRCAEYLVDSPHDAIRVLKNSMKWLPEALAAGDPDISISQVGQFLGRILVLRESWKDQMTRNEAIELDIMVDRFRAALPDLTGHETANDWRPREPWVRPPPPPRPMGEFPPIDRNPFNKVLMQHHIESIEDLMPRWWGE
jgi:hypothetical protein